MLSKYANILSTVSLVLTALTGIMAKLLGCSDTGNLTATCTGGGLLPAAYVGTAAVIFSILSLFAISTRPGGFIASMFGVTVVVVPESKSAPGVVTPAQVASK